MKIGIDVSITNINQAGTATYAHNLVNALREAEAEDKFHLFAIKQTYDMVKQKTLQDRIDTLYRDIVWAHGILPWQARQAKIDLLHIPANVTPIFSPCPTIITIHDMIAYKFPHYVTPWFRNYFRAALPLTAKKASIILTNSAHSKRDIIEILGVSPNKVVVTYLAASPDFQCLSKNKVKETIRKYNLSNFILTVSTLEPRKNMKGLLQAFALLREKGFPHQLIHVGPKGWYFNDILAQVPQLGLQDSVRFLGHIPRDDLVALYNAASVFVYPSFYEGFGLPVLEAMACGCPVVTSKCSSLPEIVEQAGIMVDPYDVNQLAEAIQNVLEDLSLAQALCQRGLSRSNAFTWQRCAHQTLDVYHQVLGR